MERCPYMYNDFEVLVSESWCLTHLTSNNITVAKALKDEYLTKKGVKGVAILNNRRQVIFFSGDIFESLRYQSIGEAELRRVFLAQYC